MKHAKQKKNYLINRLETITDLQENIYILIPMPHEIKS